MTDVQPHASAPDGQAAVASRASLAASRHLHALPSAPVPDGHSVVMSDLATMPPAADKRADQPAIWPVTVVHNTQPRASRLGGLWFGLCVVVAAVVLVAYDALVGFG